MTIRNYFSWFILLQVLCCSAMAETLALAPLYQSNMPWTDDQGKTISLSQWQGRPVIITMAFSTCRKFCPMTMARLAEIQRLFDKHNIAAEFVVISYDPIVDTWQTWAAYRQSHKLNRNNWHFLTGSQENTQNVSRLLGMDYWLYDDHVMHNFKISRLGVNGEIEKTLNWDSQEQIDSLLP